MRNEKTVFYSFEELKEAWLEFLYSLKLDNVLNWIKKLIRI